MDLTKEMQTAFPDHNIVRARVTCSPGTTKEEAANTLEQWIKDYDLKHNPPRVG
jgi:hypothetical protein